MQEITDLMLKKIVPHCPAKTRAAVLPILNKVCLDYAIVTELRIAAFVATLALESGEFRYQEELASGDAYEGRRDLGNTQKGDGVRFKGRGRIQITGRDNYRSYTEFLKNKGHLPFVDFVKEPKKLALEPYATDSAGWFFAEKIHANPQADKRNFLEIQLRVNGGRNRKPPRPNHWEERKAYYQRSLDVLPDDIFLKQREVVEILPDDEHSDFIEQPAATTEEIQTEKVEEQKVDVVQNFTAPEGTSETVKTESILQKVEKAGNQVQTYSEKITNISNTVAPISRSSWWITLTTKLAGWFLMLCAFFKDNWLELLIAFGLIALAVWYFSRAKDRANERTK